MVSTNMYLAASYVDNRSVVKLTAEAGEDSLFTLEAIPCESHGKYIVSDSLVRLKHSSTGSYLTALASSTRAIRADSIEEMQQSKWR